MDKATMTIITTTTKPKLRCARVVLSPHKKHIQKLIKIRRMETTLEPEIKKLKYEERLKEMHLSALEERRERGD